MFTLWHALYRVAQSSVGEARVMDLGPPLWAANCQKLATAVSQYSCWETGLMQPSHLTVTSVFTHETQTGEIAC